MEEQLPIPARRINDSHGANDENLALDDNTPSRQLPIKRVFSGEEATEVEALRCPVIEISDDEEESHIRLSRPGLRTTRRLDYSYNFYVNTIEQAITESLPGKRRRKDSDAPKFPSKKKQLVNGIQGEHAVLQKEHEQSVQERPRWMKEMHQRQKEREQWKKENDEWWKKVRQLEVQIQYVEGQIEEHLEI